MRPRPASRSQPASAWATSTSIQGSAKLPPCSSVCASIASSSSSAEVAWPAANSISARWLRAARSAVGSPISPATATARSRRTTASSCSPERVAHGALLEPEPRERLAIAEPLEPRAQLVEPRAAPVRVLPEPRRAAQQRLRARRYVLVTGEVTAAPQQLHGGRRVREEEMVGAHEQRDGDRALVSGVLRARRGLRCQRVRAAEVARAAHDPRPCGQRPRPQHRRRVARLEGARIRVVGLAEPRSRAEPEVESEAQPQRLPGIRLERPIERRGEVRRLRVERREHLRLARREHLPARALGQSQEHVTMAIPDQSGLGRLLEPLAPVLAHGLQQPITHARAVPVDAYQRVLDQRLQRGQDLSSREPVARAHLAGELERRAAG